MYGGGSRPPQCGPPSRLRRVAQYVSVDKLSYFAFPPDFLNRTHGVMLELPSRFDFLFLPLSRLLLVGPANLFSKS